MNMLVDKERTMKWMAVLLAFLLVCPTSAFADAKKPRGNKVKVYHESGRFRGTLLYADSELLVLKEKKSEEILGFSMPQVSRVYIRKSKAGIGILAGLVVGAGLIGAVIVGTPKKGDSLGNVLVITLLAGVAVATAAVLTVMAAAGGGILGSVFGWKRFKLFKMNPVQREAAIQKLREYAMFDVLPDELRSRMVMAGKQ
jgi:hypothetical protein